MSSGTIISCILLVVIQITFAIVIHSDNPLNPNFKLINTLKEEDRLLGVLEKVLKHPRKFQDKFGLIFRRLLYRLQYLTFSKGLTLDSLEAEAEVISGHPVNALMFTRAWAEISDFMTSIPTYQPVIDVTKALGDYSLLQRDDYLAMQDAVVRLQMVYNISTESLLKGVVGGSRALMPLNPDESYQLGRTAYLKNNYQLAREWLTEALSHNGISYHLDKSVLKDAHYIMYHLEKNDGFYESALEELETANDLDPSDSVIRSDLDLFRASIRRGRAPGLPVQDPATDSHNIYLSLCRQKKKRYRGRGFSRYTGAYPYVLYKEQVYNVKPWVSLFHDVMTDDEISALRRHVTPRLQPLQAVGSKSPLTVGWVVNKDDRLVRKLSIKMLDFIKLARLTAEAFRVVHFGVGDHYPPHMDAAGETLGGYHKKGDRMATVQFYLNDVDAGGATIFPRLRIRIEPKKGSALFWYNLDRAGRKYRNIAHAECPVLLGQKWVGTKWLREVGQQFVRPCGLTENATEDFRR